ncbi:MAG: helix-turn-helix transcriptional regulator [Phascolarctobacterium sp.]|nr:helix-turn-helix transcriptional regulator [Phascolarctobacterium sp.]
MLDEEFFIRRISDYLALRNISRNDLARLAGISTGALREIMQGKNVPTVATVEKLCKALNISVSQFFDTDDAFHDLTEDQVKLLDLWTSFSEEQREHARIYLDGLSKSDR